ncbi:signal peptide plus transmembrane domain or GPI anchor [Cryptosporidium ryanae]|uniref:signal peptide plus transmembrane domain or GPI anchor n=1 Tax=Cryptosporidium ryanae TaxID=515981 RepID=UPI00351A34EF|nr:signal peptide plus transmembrane domain or GPI anchor [Cryptosporidium ryanae]
MKIRSGKSILLFILVFYFGVLTLFIEGTGVEVGSDECINQEFVFPWGGDYLDACLAFGCRKVRDHKSWYRFWNRRPEYLHVNVNGNEQVTQCVDCEGFIKKGPLFGGMLICTPIEIGGKFATPKGWVSLATGSLRLNEVIKKKSSLKLIPNNWRINGSNNETSLDFSKCLTQGEDSILTLSIIVTVSNVLTNDSKLPKYRKKLRLLSEDINVRIKTLNYRDEESVEDDLIDDVEDDVQYDNTDEYTLFDNSKFTFNQEEIMTPKKQVKTKKKVFTGAERLPRGWKLSKGQTSIYSSSDVIDIQVAGELNPNELAQVVLTCNNRFMDCNIQDFVSCFNIMCKSTTKEDLIRRTALKKARQFISDSIIKGETKPILGVPQTQSEIGQVSMNTQILNQFQLKQGGIVSGINYMPPRIMTAPTTHPASGTLVENKFQFGNVNVEKPVDNVFTQNSQSFGVNKLVMPPVFGANRLLINDYSKLNDSNKVDLNSRIANGAVNYAQFFPGSFENTQNLDVINYSDDSEESEEIDDIVLPTNTNLIDNRMMLKQNTSINENVLNQPSMNIIKCIKPVAKVVRPVASGAVITGNVRGNIYKCLGTEAQNTTFPDNNLNILKPKILNIIPQNSLDSNELLVAKNCVKVLPVETVNLQVPVRIEPEANKVKDIQIINLNNQGLRTVKIVRGEIVEAPANKPKIILIKDNHNKSANLVENEIEKPNIPRNVKKLIIEKEEKPYYVKCYGSSKIIIPKKQNKEEILIDDDFKYDKKLSSNKKPKKLILLDKRKRSHSMRNENMFIDKVSPQKYILAGLDALKKKPKKIFFIKDNITGEESEVVDLEDCIPRRKAGGVYISDKNYRSGAKSSSTKEYISDYPQEDDYSTIILKRIDQRDNVSKDECNSESSFDNVGKLQSMHEQKRIEMEDKRRDDTSVRNYSDEEPGNISSSESQKEINHISTKTNLETKKIGKSVLGYSIFTAIVLFVFFIIIRLFLL